LNGKIPFHFHPPGELSRSGVLDVGLKCAHSCRFCYYSYMSEGGENGNGGQFDALRRASFRSTADCLRILDLLAQFGFVNIDITGGEPTMHEGLPDMVRRACRHGMSVRIVTLGQFLMPERRSGEPLLDTLLDAGVTDFLFSLHASSEEEFRQTTRGSLKKLISAMDALDNLRFQYSVNTVIHSGNVGDLPRIAELSAARGVYHHNFIVFNAYHGWNTPSSISGLQASHGDIAQPLKRAVGILDSAGVAVSIRYLPLCVVPDLARHIVGVVGVHHDPHEWMNRAGNPDRAPEYCAEPLPVPEDGPREIYALSRRPRRLDFGPEGVVDAVALRGDAFKVFPELCRRCSAMTYCDGLDPKYLLLHGLSGLTPQVETRGRGPLLLERRTYLPAFVLKRTQDADMQRAIGRVTGRQPLVSNPLVTAVVDSGDGSETTLAALKAQVGVRLDVMLCDSRLPPGTARNHAAAISSGSVLAFLPAGTDLAPTAMAGYVDLLTRRSEISLVVAGKEVAIEFQELLQGQSVGIPLVLRRQAFDDAGGFSDGLTDCLEWDFQLAAAAAGHFGASGGDTSSTPPGRHVGTEQPEFPQVVRRTPDIFPRKTALACSARKESV
jgi:pyruvate-formate lyase-activating enzyme